VDGTFFCRAGFRVCRRRAGSSGAEEARPPRETKRVARNETVTSGGDDFIVEVKRRRGDGESDDAADAKPQPDVDVIVDEEPCAGVDVSIPDATEPPGNDPNGKAVRRRRRPMFCLPLRLRVGTNPDGAPASIRLDLPDRYTSRGVLPDDATVTLVPAEDPTVRRLSVSGVWHRVRRLVAGSGCTTVTYDDAAGSVSGDNCTPSDYVVVMASQSRVKDSDDHTPLIVGVVVGVGGGLIVAAIIAVVVIKSKGKSKGENKVAAAPKPDGELCGLQCD
jgi:hypothetical protein